MELFARCDREPERLLAVTEGGRRYTLGDLNAAAGRLGRAVGGHRLVFLLCENTPGSLLGYFACLRTGAVQFGCTIVTLSTTGSRLCPSQPLNFLYK